MCVRGAQSCSPTEAHLRRAGGAGAHVGGGHGGVSQLAQAQREAAGAMDGAGKGRIPRGRGRVPGRRHRGRVEKGLAPVHVRSTRQGRGFPPPKRRGPVRPVREGG